MNVNKVSNAAGNIATAGNEFIDCQRHFVFEIKDDGTTSEVQASSNNDRFENDGRTMSEPIITDDMGNGIKDKVVVSDPVIDSSVPPIIWDDDDDYVPPIVPAQPSDSGDDNTVTVVACAAAAVVAALMAAFLILDRKR